MDGDRIELIVGGDAVHLEDENDRADLQRVAGRELGLLNAFTVAIGAVGRSASRYDGPAVFVWSAWLIVLVVYVGGLFLVGISWYFFPPDLSATSLNIQKKIQYDPEYPYIGFWKIDCADPFGLVVEKADAGAYFVRFCAPLACFRKGPMNRVKFGEESFYQIIDDATMGVSISLFPTNKFLETQQAEIQGSIKDNMLLIKKCS